MKPSTLPVRTRKARPLPIAAAAVLALAASAAAQAQQKWDLPTGYPANNFHTENIVQFVADIEKAAPGKLAITLHPAGSLFKLNEIKRAVQGGQAQAGEVLLSSLSNEDAFYGVDSLPFLVDGFQQSKKLWQATRAGTEARFAKQGMKILYAVPWPPQGIFSAQPIASTADLKGAKWRAYNPNTSRIAQLVGAQPVTIQQAELSQALATGAVTSFMTSGATGFDSKVWEQIKHYVDAQAWLPKNIVFVNQKAFDALDAPTKDAVLKAAAAAEERGWKVAEEKTAWYNDQMRKNGMTVATPNAKLQGELKAIGQTMLDEWLKQTGADGQAAIAAFRK